MTPPRQSLSDALEQLADPMRLRVAVCGLALVIAFMAIYSPMDGAIERASRQQKQLKQHQAVSQDVAFLQQQEQLLLPRLGGRQVGDSVQYVIDGVRQLALKLERLEPAETVRVGPLEAAEMTLVVQGAIQQLDSLLEWLDTNSRVYRVESFRIVPGKDADSLPTMQVKLLALKERS
jgi:hypothetical protein